MAETTAQIVAGLREMQDRLHHRIDVNDKKIATLEGTVQDHTGNIATNAAGVATNAADILMYHP